MLVSSITAIIPAIFVQLFFVIDAIANFVFSTLSSSAALSHCTRFTGGSKLAVPQSSCPPCLAVGVPTKPWEPWRLMMNHLVRALVSASSYRTFLEH